MKSIPSLALVALGCCCGLLVWHLRAGSQTHAELYSMPTYSARLQALWNAAKHDEIRLDNNGRLQRYEMTPDRAQLLKIDPEYDDDVPHTARITTATKAVYHPLEWMQQEPVPSAVKPRSTAMVAARMQQLWNAAANDVIQPTSGGESDSPPAIEWLNQQHDEAEVAAMRSKPGYAFGDRIFSRGGDHARNMAGDYVEDNDIGVKVAAMRAQPAMLRSQGAARTQQLWNAGADDEVQAAGGAESEEEDGDSDVPPAGEWLEEQHDEAETADMRARPRYGFGRRVFARGGDHARNRRGDYVEDNDIGVKVGALAGRATMLDMWDQPNPGAAASGGSDGSMTWMGYRSATDGFNRNQSPYTGPGGAQDYQTPRDPKYSAGGRVYGAPGSSTQDPNYGYSDYWKQHYGVNK